MSEDEGSPSKEEPLGEKVLWIQAIHIPDDEVHDIFSRIEAMRLPCKVILAAGNLKLVSRKELLDALHELASTLEQEKPKEGRYIT